MKSKQFSDRWENSSEGKSALKKITSLLIKGGELSVELTPFANSANEMLDFKGLPMRGIKISNCSIINCDLSYSDFSNTSIENCLLVNTICNNVLFNNIIDKGNNIENVIFQNCKFNNAAFGYEGTKYSKCKFIKCNFTQSIYIRGEFYHCEFNECILKNLDYNATFFENCSFEGSLKNLWFRGGYFIPDDKETFGRNKTNKMANVSFKKASLEDLTFSDNCILDSVILPESGNYIRFNHWLQRLEYVKSKIQTWTNEYKKRAELFVFSHMVHAAHQDWYIINVTKLQDDLGLDLANNLIIDLKKGAVDN